MKIQIELKKEKNFYCLSSNNPCFVCYGKTIKEVFNNLGKLFIKLQELNQLTKELK